MQKIHESIRIPKNIIYEVEIMEQKKENKDAIQILHKRYITDEKRKASLEKERVNAEVARMIHELRVDAGLSQQELADLIETTQSVISRLEDGCIVLLVDVILISICPNPIPIFSLAVWSRFGHRTS